jgi:hypothetical protein
MITSNMDSFQPDGRTLGSTGHHSTESLSSSPVVRFGLPVAIGLAYLLLTFNPNYQPFLVDEALFQEAMAKHTLTFFPGYIGFLWAGNALSSILSPPAALQLIASVLGSAAVTVFWLWMRRWRLPLGMAVMGTMVFATSVYQLWNSSVGVTYSAEALAFLGTGYLCLNATRNDKSLYLAAFVLALIGAVRQTTPIFLMPLFLYTCRRAKTLKPVLLFAVLSLAWFVPTVIYFGGASNMVSTAGAQVNRGVTPSTILVSPKMMAVNLMRFTIFLAYGAHVLLLFALKNLRRYELIWIVPGALFFSLFYVAWPGYVLGILAVVILVGVRSISRLRPRLAYSLLIAIAVFNCLQFYVFRPIPQPNTMVKAVATAYAFQYSQAAIRDRYQRRLRDLIGDSR